MENKAQQFNFEAYSYKRGLHRDNQVIWIHFPYNLKLINHLKKHIKAKWSRTASCWYVPDNKYYRKLFNIPVAYYSLNGFNQIFPTNQKELTRYIEELQLRGYSENTIGTYTNEFIQLLKILKTVDVKSLDPEKIRSYLLYCKNALKLSEATIHSRINALKFYYEKVLGRQKLFLNIPRPKKAKLLPKSLSTSEIKRMLNTITNKKHSLLLKMCYGMGLRVSELINIRIGDIDSGRMQVLVSRGKGKKDRYVILPASIIEELREYYRKYKPIEYLFEGQRGGQYSKRRVPSL